MSPTTGEPLLVPMSHGGTGSALVCFPPAGAGSGFFGAWKAVVPPEVTLWGVRLPGRESLYGQPPFADVETAAERVAAVLLRTVTGDVVVVGQCLGAHLAYEVARRVEDLLPVRWLAVAGAGPPVVDPAAATTAVESTSDAELLAELARVSPIPAGLRTDGELARVLLPALRADSLMAERYLRTAPGLAVRTPVVALVARAGEGVPVDQLRGWERLTLGGFALHDVADPNLSSRQTAADLLGFLDVRPPARRQAVKG
jgi:medium-chain acyl-[acyl-carrier-protein] hydrolase